MSELGLDWFYLDGWYLKLFRPQGFFTYTLPPSVSWADETIAFLEIVLYELSIKNTPLTNHNLYKLLQ